MTTVRRRPPAPKLAETKVLRRVDITDDLLLMWISRPQGFNFKAGQYCTIGSEGIERAYSISSAPHEEDIELFVELASYAGQEATRNWCRRRTAISHPLCGTSTKATR